jgi:translocation and assembly module TamB
LIVAPESVSKALGAPDDFTMSRVKTLRFVGALLLLVVVGAALVWLARKPIADAALRRAIAARGVQASYTVKSIGLRWERVENLRIGDPKSPDLVADWAEIRVTTGLNGVTVKAVRAGGVRVRGRLINGRLSLGEIDRLLPKSDVKMPFAMPDIDVDVADARVRIDSPWGQIGGRVDGKGNLTDGFIGKVAAIAPSIKVGGCDASRATAYVDLRIRNREPTLKGPIRADSANCVGVAVAKPALVIDATLNAALDQWRGEAAVQAQGVRNANATLAVLSGTVSFEGNAAVTNGSANLAAAAGRFGSVRLAGVGVKGRFSTAHGASGTGQVAVARLMTDASFVASLDHAARGATDTPIGPMLVQVATSTRQAASGLKVVAEASFGGGSATVTNLLATSASGASLRASGGSGMRFGAAGFVADTQLMLSGGGFPAVQSTLKRRADGMTVGVAQVSPFVGGGSRVAFDRIRFAANPLGAMRFETLAVLDGAFGGGRVDGLRFPVNATIATNGSVIINNGCTPLAFRALSISGLKLNPSALRLCPSHGYALFAAKNGQIEGGAIIDAPRLSGRLGGTPVNLAAGKVRVTLGTTGFTIDKLSARAGTAERLSRFETASLGGSFVNGGFQGRFGGTSGKIGNVPLLIDKASGEWTYRNGRLALRSGLTVSDESVPGRFNPLVSEDASLRLINGRIDASATLQSPKSSTEVTKVHIAHDLGTGKGNAALTVADLRFGKSVQPEDLTRLTLGVIANVEGAISGSGEIHWTPDGVTSSGRFETQGLDFAAAFGPVSGLKGAIVFNDLLGLATPAGQRVTIASVNPGTLVTNGLITYQLLPDQRITVESGVWPFAGGDLLLDPTTLDMGQEAERKLTFRVVGLDAAKFIQQLEFENLSATGTFDGIMPMYFDASGGRIEGGRLVVRQGGGTLAYVGEISNTAMSVYAKLAFDALKSIRYKNLTIALNGPLDGEIISQINFNGINEAPLAPPKSFIARQFIGLPFVFNIKVTAPFRSLMNTARTIQDPTSLLQRTLPELRKPAVQPPESETKP